MKTIHLTCRSCSAVHTVQRTSEIPLSTISMESNWCPKCEQTASEPYEEWLNEPSVEAPKKEFVPDNQLKFPFGFSSDLVDINQ